MESPRESLNRFCFPDQFQSSGHVDLLDLESSAGPGCTEYSQMNKNRALEKNASQASQHSSVRIWNGMSRRRRGLIRAAPALFASTIWLILLIYLLIWYLTLPRVGGHRPRISPVYALWPYISCIGGERLTVFRCFAVIVAFCSVSALLLDFHPSRHTETGYWLRRLKVCCGFSSSCFLIALSFISANSTTPVHLIITTMAIWTTLIAKLSGFTTDHLMRKAIPPLRHERALRISRRWKECTALVNGACAVIVMVGIYGCPDHEAIQTHGTRCHRIVSAGAPAEWVTSLCWISWISCLGWDLYNADRISQVCRAYREAQEMAHAGNELRGVP